MKKELVTRDLNKEYEIFVSIKNITSCFAKWAIQLSPYKVPDNLEIAVLKFHARLEEYFSEYLTMNNEWINAKLSEKEWSDKISSIIVNRNFAEVYQWNERKNGNNSKFNFTSAYTKIDPDDDFIDLHALSRNIEIEIWKEHSVSNKKESEFAKENKK